MKAERLLEIAFALDDAYEDYYANRTKAKFDKMMRLQKEFRTARWQYKGYDACSSA